MMLKIKDSVDLKELEKFCKLKIIYNRNTGKVDEVECWGKKYATLLWFKRKHLLFRRNENNLILNTFARDYDFDDVYLGSRFHYDADLLYDLIKADMVEKVEE